LEILEELSRGQKCVTEVEQTLEEVSQPNISQHLAVLRHCGVVGFRREGNKRCYFLAKPDMISRLLAILREGYGSE
ncbi:MAG: ArsR family transcriptional regulator, partial [Chloroflexi bacterium CG07_land_8_20_14_0_80_51_10]